MHIHMYYLPWLWLSRRAGPVRGLHHLVAPQAAGDLLALLLVLLRLLYMITITNSMTITTICVYYYLFL